MLARQPRDHVLRERPGPRDGDVQVVDHVLNVVAEIVGRYVDFVERVSGGPRHGARVGAFVVARIGRELSVERDAVGGVGLGREDGDQA